MKKFILGLWLGCAALAWGKDADDVSARTSPRGTFTITQSFGPEGWDTKLHFTKEGQPDLALGERWPWPAIYEISPDEKWIWQSQKIGSGENTVLLFHFDGEGRLWRMEQDFKEFVFEYLKRKNDIAAADLYHTGFEFVGWDPRAGAVRFIVRGSSLEKSGEGIRRELIYDLGRHSLRPAGP